MDFFSKKQKNSDATKKSILVTCYGLKYFEIRFNTTHIVGLELTKEIKHIEGSLKLKGQSHKIKINLSWIVGEQCYTYAWLSEKVKIQFVIYFFPFWVVGAD